jgi:hypothetical protein
MDEIRLKGAPMEGYALEVMVPAETGDTDITLDIYIFAATASGVDSDDALIGQTPVQLNENTIAGQHILPFNLPGDGYEYVKAKMDVGGTSPDFSNIVAYIIHNVGATWSRGVSFD